MRYHLSINIILLPPAGLEPVAFRCALLTPSLYPLSYGGVKEEPSVLGKAPFLIRADWVKNADQSVSLISDLIASMISAAPV